MRLGIASDWKSRWFNLRDYRELLRQDVRIRELVMKKFAKMAIKNVEIERSGNKITVIIHTARPGLIIGRGGVGIEQMEQLLRKSLTDETVDKKPEKFLLKLDVKEVTRPDSHAALVAQNVASQLEKRMPFRRVMKQAIEKSMQEKDVEGIKIVVAGRLGGAEIARNEKLSRGRLPLQTLRANVDFARENAYTTFGVIGVKVWIYKGEVFKEDKSKNNLSS